MSESYCVKKKELEEKCHPKCTTWYDSYLACKERIEKKGHGHCSGQYFDYFTCVDKCVSAVGKLSVCPFDPFLLFRLLLPCLSN